MLAQAARPEPAPHLVKVNRLMRNSRSARRALQAARQHGVFPSIQPLQISIDTTIPPR